MERCSRSQWRPSVPGHLRRVLPPLRPQLEDQLTWLALPAGGRRVGPSRSPLKKGGRREQRRRRQTTTRPQVLAVALDNRRFYSGRRRALLSCQSPLSHAGRARSYSCTLRGAQGWCGRSCLSFAPKKRNAEKRIRKEKIVYERSTSQNRKGEKERKKNSLSRVELCVSGPFKAPALHAVHRWLGPQPLVLLFFPLLLLQGGEEAKETKATADRRRRQQQRQCRLPPPPRQPLATPIRSAQRTSPKPRRSSQTR